MLQRIGIRKEDKNIWERRVPLIPEDLKELKEKHGITVFVEKFERRSYTEEEYANAGIETVNDIYQNEIIIAVKEIPVKYLLPGKTYIFFSHTIKAQKYNMPMLKHLIKNGCTLIDYECIADEKGRRLVFFGKYAGLAGMIDTLFGYGQRLAAHGISNDFEALKQSYQYHDVDEAKDALRDLGEKIKKHGVPETIHPVIAGFAGYGNVSLGGQEIYDVLPVETLSPDFSGDINSLSRNKVYKIVFKESDMFERIESPEKFDLQEYFNQPVLYKSKFNNHIQRLSIFINAIYWDEKYPRLITKEFLKNNKTRLEIIGDISCDIEGAVEITAKITTPDIPSFVYNPETSEFVDGFSGDGVSVIAIDNLPAELPRDASAGFSKSLKPFIPAVAAAKKDVEFENYNLPPEIKKAVIVYNGKLTPKYSYLQKYIV